MDLAADSFVYRGQDDLFSSCYVARFSLCNLGNTIHAAIMSSTRGSNQGIILNTVSLSLSAVSFLICGMRMGADVFILRSIRPDTFVALFTFVRVPDSPQSRLALTTILSSQR